jgi:hypothetical protein
MSKTKNLYEKKMMDWFIDQSIDDSYRYEQYLSEYNQSKNIPLT